MPGVEGGLGELLFGEGVDDGARVTVSLKFDTATCVCEGGGVDGAASVVAGGCWLFVKSRLHHVCHPPYIYKYDQPEPETATPLVDTAQHGVETPSLPADH